MNIEEIPEEIQSLRDNVERLFKQDSETRQVIARLSLRIAHNESGKHTITTDLLDKFNSVDTPKMSTVELPAYGINRKGNFFAHASSAARAIPIEATNIRILYDIQEQEPQLTQVPSGIASINLGDEPIFMRKRME